MGIGVGADHIDVLAVLQDEFLKVFQREFGKIDSFFSDLLDFFLLGNS